jgi:hypothetical protein
MDLKYDDYGDATIIKCQSMNATCFSSFNWTNRVRNLNVPMTASTEAVSY